MLGKRIFGQSYWKKEIFQFTSLRYVRKIACDIGSFYIITILILFYNLDFFCILRLTKFQEKNNMHSKVPNSAESEVLQIIKIKFPILPLNTQRLKIQR